MSASRAQRKLEITLLQERNAGTFARVYMARARSPDGLTRIVAVKVLREKWTDTKEIITRTRDEAQLLARLQHPNILRVEAITEVEQQPAIVMEFVHGTDLGQLISALGERNEPFSPRAVYEIMERLLSALAAAYFKVPVGMSDPLRVVHRDIKPSNIMISVEGALKVLDFGTARFEDVERMAKTEAIRFGSLKYMSPERREGDRGDHVSDIYGAGLLFLELLLCETLASPPMSEAEHDTFIRDTIARVPDFGLPNEAWDDSLVLTLCRMLAYDPVARLDAQQCIPLFRQFKDQAIGESLNAFAEQIVSPLSNTLNVEPDSPHGGGFQLTPDGDRTSTLDVPIVEAMDSGDGEPDPVAPDLQTTDPELDLQRPGFAIRDLDTEDLSMDSDPVTDANISRPVAQVGHGEKSRVTAPAVQTAAPTGKPTTSSLLPAAIYATLGCVVVSVILGAVLTATYFAARHNTQTADAPTQDATEVEAAIEDLSAAVEEVVPDLEEEVAATDFAVELQAGDPTVQWIRMYNDTGDNLLTARPDATGQLPAGTYEIKVKVVARTALSGTVSIQQDTYLSCKPATMGRIRCSDRDGNKVLVIRP